jgi:hypothetical protein
VDVLLGSSGVLKNVTVLMDMAPRTILLPSGVISMEPVVGVSDVQHYPLFSLVLSIGQSG